MQGGEFRSQPGALRGPAANRTDNREVRGPNPNRLAVPRGHGYLAGWGCLVLFTFLAMTFALFGGTPVLVLAFAAFAILGLAGILLYRGERYLEVDEWGVRLRRGTTALREIPWRDVREVRYGTRVVSTAGAPAREGIFLTVRGRSFWRRIDFDTEGFAVPDSELARFAAHVASMASVRGVPVERRTPHPKTA